LLTTVTTLLAFRSDVETTVLRTPGMLYQKLENNIIGNLYNVQVVNKTFKKFPVELKLKSPSGSIRYVGNGLGILDQQSLSETVFFICIPANEIKSVKTPVVLEVISNGKVLQEVKTNFMGPVSNL
jgi:hypothetical protein